MHSNQDLIQIPIDDEQTSYEVTIATLKRSEYRFVLCLFGGDDTWEGILTEAYKQGVAGTGVHNWFFTEGGPSMEPREENSALHLAMRGMGQIVYSSGLPGVGSFDLLGTKLEELRTTADFDYMESLVPPASQQHVVSQFNKSHVYRPSPFVYEAVVALGLSACQAYEQNNEFTGQEHFDAMMQSNFTGITGSVRFNSETGSRDPTTALYKVVNFVDQVTEDGLIDLIGRVTDLYESGSWNHREDYIFNDGTTKLPRDLPLPTELPKTRNVLLGVLLPVLMTVAAVVIVGVIGFVLYTKKIKQNDLVWKVDLADIHFDDPPLVLGRGTFGLVLLAEYHGTKCAVKRVMPKRSKGNGVDSQMDIECAIDKPQRGNNKSSNIGLRSGQVQFASIKQQSIGIKSVRTQRSSLFNRTSNGQSEGKMIRKLKEDFVQEMRQLSKLRHPNVTTIMGKKLAHNKRINLTFPRSRCQR